MFAKSVPLQRNVLSTSQIIEENCGSYQTLTRLGPQGLILKQIHLTVPHLPPGFEGYRILHMTDLHFGPTLAYAEIKEAVAWAAFLQPDLIAVTGDFVTSFLDELLVEQLSRLSAPDGVWAVLGNHDHWTDPAGLREILPRSGVIELANANVCIGRGPEHVWLAGVDDVWEGLDDLERALCGIPEGAVIILLVHEPDFADEAAGSARIAVQLSGHSHGGQICLPILEYPLFGPFLKLARKYPRGVYKIGHMWLHTSSGVGRGPSPRFNCPPDIAEITLHSSVTA